MGTCATCIAISICNGVYAWIAPLYTEFARGGPRLKRGSTLHMLCMQTCLCSLNPAHTFSACVAWLSSLQR